MRRHEPLGWWGQEFCPIPSSLLSPWEGILELPGDCAGEALASPAMVWMGFSCPSRAHASCETWPRELFLIRDLFFFLKGFQKARDPGRRLNGRDGPTPLGELWVGGTGAAECVCIFFFFF